MKACKRHTKSWYFATLLSVVLLTNGYAFAQPRAYCSGVCDLDWSPVDANLLAAVNATGLWLYHVDDELTEPTLFPHPNLTSLSFDPEGRSIAVTSCPTISEPRQNCSGSLSIFDIEEQMWHELASYDYRIHNVQFSRDGRYVAFEKEEVGKYGLGLIDLTTGETFAISEFYMTNRILYYAFDSQSTRIAVSNGSFDMSTQFNGISMWSLPDQSLLASTENGILAYSLMFDPSDNEITFVESNSQVSTWNYETGTVSPIRKLVDIMHDPINDYAFYPPSYLAASILDDWIPADRRLFIWGIDSGEQLFYEDMPEDRFSDLITINRNGELIVFTSTMDPRMILEIHYQSTTPNIIITLTP